MVFDEKEILRQWDIAAESYEFQMLDNGYFYHCDQKLTIYRDAERWAMTIETFAYFNRLPEIEGINTYASVFGNCLLCFDNNKNFFSFATDKNKDIETFVWDDEVGLHLNKEAKSILVKGVELEIITDLDVYASKKITPSYPGYLTPWEVMRAWVPEKSHLFWISREELSSKIPIDLPVLMTLDSWHHPNLIENEPPSNTETFRQLAKVISTGDISYYNKPEKDNTHWSNWPDGGLC